MSTVVVRTQLEADEPAVVELWNGIYLDLAPRTVASYRAEYAALTPGVDLFRFVAEVRGSIAGFLSLEEVTWLRRPGVYFARLAVAPSQQGAGIGRRLAMALDEAAGGAGAEVIYARVREGDERATSFAALQGFTPTGDVDRVSRLLVAGARLDGLDDLRRRLQEHGIRICRLASLRPDEALLHALHAMTDETRVDIPSAEPFGGEHYDVWQARYLDRPGMSPEWIWVALAGDEPVGAAYLNRYTAEVAGNSYTGVKRAYRGLGIARALKLEQIAWAREHGIRSIHTRNDAHNAGMLAVNTALGYEFLPGMIEVGKELVPEDSGEGAVRGTP